MTRPMLCAILDDYQNVALSFADWSVLDRQITIRQFSENLGGAAAESLVDYDIIVAMRERTVFDANLLAHLPKLKLLITTGMANASIDMKAAGDLGITVVGTRGSIGPAAELTWGLLLSLARHIPEEVANLRAGSRQWQLSTGYDLQGKVLGVAGIGKLGQRVAGYGRAFGMEVLGWSRSNTPERSAELGIEYAPALDDLLTNSDVVSLHLPLTAETRGVIGAREISLMKDGAILLNTSRGPLIDEAALIAALENGKLRGAGLDVFDTEPLPDSHPFRTLANVIATPHLGYVTEETYRIYFSDAVEAIAAWCAGTPIRILNEPDLDKKRS